MFGRDAELADLLDVLAEGSAPLVLIAGDPLSGRSTLLAEAARADTGNSVSVTARLAERAQSLSGLSMILTALGDGRLAEFVGRFRLVDGEPESIPSAARDILGIIRSAHVDPVTVYLDDIDCLDDASRELIAYLAPRLIGSGVRVVATCEAAAAESEFAGAPTVPVTRLDAAASARLLHSLQPDVDDHVIEVLCTAANGLPGVLAQAAAHLTASQRRGIAPLVLPLRPDIPATGRTDDAPARDLLRRVASAPLSTVASIDLQGRRRAVFERLLGDGLLDSSGPYVRIADPVLRAGIYWQMEPDERRAVHTEAESAERGVDGPAAFHARQVQPDERSALAVVEDAVAFARAGLDDAAVEMLESALLAVVDHRPFVDGILDCAEIFVLRGHFAAARRYLGFAARATPVPEQILRAASIGFGERMLVTGAPHSDELVTLVERHGAAAPAWTSKLLSLVAALRTTQSDVVGARSALTAAPIGVRHDPASLGYGIARVVAAVDGGDGPATDLAPAVGEMRAPVLLAAARALSWEARYEEADRCLAALTRSMDAPEIASESWQHWEGIARAENDVRAGRVRDAIAVIDACPVEGSPLPFRLLLLQAWRAQMVGDAGEAVRLLGGAHRFPQATRYPLATAEVCSLRASTALMVGDLEEAVYRVERVRTIGPAVRLDVLRSAADRVEALARSDARTRARRAFEEFAHDHSSAPSEWSRVALARARTLVVGDEHVAAAARDALHVAADAGSTLEHGRTALACAFALARARRPDDAEDARRVAEQLFDEVGAEGWAAAARRMTIAPSATRVDPLLSTLTDNELAVLRLIRQGARNKDIAAALFVSLRTVEVRITQIYRKLDARSRSHLLALLPSELDDVGT